MGGELCFIVLGCLCGAYGAVGRGVTIVVYLRRPRVLIDAFPRVEERSDFASCQR